MFIIKSKLHVALCSIIIEKNCKLAMKSTSLYENTGIVYKIHCRHIFRESLITKDFYCFFHLLSLLLAHTNRIINRMCDKSQEARRVLLSDINFTSMVPELSRSADHLCQEDQDQNNGNNENSTKGYHKGPHLKTPDYSNRG